MYAHTVGADNFYLLYEVMVQAYNVKEGTDEKRYGPTSPVAYVYSAEGSKLWHCLNHLSRMELPYLITLASPFWY